jgi:hypothetical protein
MNFTEDPLGSLLICIKIDLTLYHVFVSAYMVVGFTTTYAISAYHCEFEC